ncbi:hypothetical protein NKI38_14215 [Mesorhizobium sp. M0621]|uniref:hypothetical protein n=1 Tax=Mesorhizobium sp. M0621 TaxID=2956974 RepID=UPI0033391A8B
MKIQIVMMFPPDLPKPDDQVSAEMAALVTPHHSFQRFQGLIRSRDFQNSLRRRLNKAHASETVAANTIPTVRRGADPWNAFIAGAIFTVDRLPFPPLVSATMKTALILVGKRMGKAV